MRRQAGHHRLERGQRREVRGLDHFLEHRGHGVSLGDRLPRRRSVVVLLFGIHEFLQIEILVLKRVSQLVRQNQGLHFGRRPVGDIHDLVGRVVKSRRLLGIKIHQKFLQVKVRRDEPKSLEHRLLIMDFLGRIVFVNLSGHEFLDLGPAHEFFFQRGANGETRDAAHLLEGLIGRREERLRLLERGNGGNGQSKKSDEGDTQSKAQNFDFHPKLFKVRQPRLTEFETSQYSLPLTSGFWLLASEFRLLHAHLTERSCPAYHGNCASKPGDRCPAGASRFIGAGIGGGEESPNSIGQCAR